MDQPCASSSWTGLRRFTRCIHKQSPKLCRDTALRRSSSGWWRPFTSPTFTVRAAGKTSQPSQASSGIRQGCPLSPYLFLVVHSMIMADVDEALQQNGKMLPWLLSQNQEFYDLAYADDTAIFTRAAERGQQILHQIQEVAAFSNLSLNYKNC